MISLLAGFFPEFKLHSGPVKSPNEKKRKQEPIREATITTQSFPPSITNAATRKETQSFRPQGIPSCCRRTVRIPSSTTTTARPPAVTTPRPPKGKYPHKANEMMCSSSDGVLSDESGSVVVKPCTEREVAFYESALAHPEFAKWMPTFFGTLSLSGNVAPDADITDGDGKPHDRKSSLVLQNLTYGFDKPCVLDVKLGAQLWDQYASLEKRARLDAVSDKTTSRKLGLRIAGMRVWKGEAEGYKAYDKFYGRDFTADNVIDAIKEYFTSDISPEQVKLIAGRFTAKLTEIRKVLESQESRMYSASLLFVFEGNGKVLDQALEDEKNRQPKDEDEDDEDDDEKIKMVEELKLIDFAHADWTPGQGPDENALQGVRSMEKLMAELV
jgi:1D-myo-inositol-tetrakisphosphate 5-kinase/inositol-polyphosphate multikinase